MTLVVYSKHDLKSLEDLISPHFRTLENKNIDLISLERLPFSQLTNVDTNGKTISIKKINDFFFSFFFSFI